MDMVRVAVFALGLGLLIRAVWEAREAGGFPLTALLKAWFSPSPAKLLAAGAGVACVATVPLIGLVLGWVRIAPRGDLSMRWLGLAVAGIAVKMVWVGFEELIFRGAMVSQLRDRIGTAGSGLVSAVAFAAAHGGRTPLDRGILFADGVAFAAAFVITGSLWVPAIWHAAKNLSVWLLFGRGSIDLAPGPFVLRPDGPDWVIRSGPGASPLELALTILVVALTIGTLNRTKKGTGRR